MQKHKCKKNIRKYKYPQLILMQAADGGLDFRVLPPTASPSEQQSTPTGKPNKMSNKSTCIYCVFWFMIYETWPLPPLLLLACKNVTKNGKRKLLSSGDPDITLSYIYHDFCCLYKDTTFNIQIYNVPLLENIIFN